jgi:hypothetical protein
MVLTYYAEEQPNEPEQGDDEPMNPLVDALFDEVENLRLQVSMTIDFPCLLILMTIH